MCKELNKHNNVKLIILSSFQNVARPIFNDVPRSFTEYVRYVATSYIGWERSA